MGISETQPFVDVIAGRPLTWTQPKRMRRAWEMKAGDAVIATLFRARWYGPTLRARSPAGEWDAVLRWTGFDLRRAGEKEAVIRYRSLLAGRGRMMLGEEELLWRGRLHWIRPMSFELQTTSESPLLRLIPRRQLLRSGGDFEVTDLGLRHRQLEPLLIFSWALAIFSHRRAHG